MLHIFQNTILLSSFYLYLLYILHDKKNNGYVEVSIGAWKTTAG
jgi:hypothetical protein